MKVVYYFILLSTLVGMIHCYDHDEISTSYQEDGTDDADDVEEIHTVNGESDRNDFDEKVSDHALTVECSPNCDISSGLKAGTITGEAGKSLIIKFTIDNANFIAFALKYDNKNLLIVLRYPTLRLLTWPNRLFDFGHKKLVKRGANKYSFAFKLIKLNLAVHNMKVFRYALIFPGSEITGTLTINVRARTSVVRALTVECSPNCDISSGLIAGTINGEEGNNLKFKYTIDSANFVTFVLRYDNKYLLTVLRYPMLRLTTRPNRLFDFGDTKLVKVGANKYSFAFTLIKLDMTIHNKKVFSYTLVTLGSVITGTLAINVRDKK